jgi:hypothetical protein
MIERIRSTCDERFAAAFAATLAILVAALAVPVPAYADIGADINSWLCGVLRDTCNWIFNSQVSVLSSIGTGGVLSADFTQMLGSSGTVTMYDVARGVWEVAILPIGCGVLSFVFTVQLIKISQRMDGNAAMPGVKEVVFLLVFFAVFLFLIQNSFELMRSIYEVCRLAIDRTAGLFGSGSQLSLQAVSITTDDDVAALLAMLVVALVSWLVVIVAYVVALVVSWARAIQIYVMAAFSPIPLSLMSLDETRQMGVGYIKNFAAVCLAGVIILVLLVSFPIVLGGLNAATAGTGTPIDSVVGGLSYALQYMAICILLIFSLAKSGSWARDILGG